MVLLNCGEQLSAAASNGIRAWSARGSSSGTADRGRGLRTYGIGAQILRDLGVGEVRMMAKPRKMRFDGWIRD